MIDSPWYDLDPRRTIEQLNKKIQEDGFVLLKEYEGVDIVKVSPVFLAFSILTAGNSHLNLILATCKKTGIHTTSEELKRLYSELLALHYILTTSQLSKYLHDDQFTLFILRTHAALLDITFSSNGILSLLLETISRSIKKKQDDETEKLRQAISNNIQEYARFYLLDELNEKDKKELVNDLAFFGIKEDGYKNNIDIQFIVKTNYQISNTLSVRENPAYFLSLCVVNKHMVVASLEMARKVRPTWHLPGDEGSIIAYKMKNQG